MPENLFSNIIFIIFKVGFSVTYFIEYNFELYSQNDSEKSPEPLHIK
jgi:hypothetical protein